MLERVRDDVRKEVLRRNEEQVEADLGRGDLVLACCSAQAPARPSLIAPLLNEVVGEGGRRWAPQRTDCHSYRCG